MKKTNLQKILTEIAKKLLEDDISFRIIDITGCHSKSNSSSCHSSSRSSGAGHC